MRVVLVNAGLPADVAPCLRANAYPPLSLIYLATYLRQEHPTIDIKLLDDQLGDPIEPGFFSDCGLIGISANTLTYPRAIEIAQNLKATGVKAPIVLGGIHATLLPVQILLNRDCFDFVVAGQGEISLSRLAGGERPDSVPNVYWATSGRVHRPHDTEFKSIGALPVPDFSFLPLNRYAARFGRHYRNKAAHRPVAIVSSTGCDWRSRCGGCFFCSIPNLPCSRLNPEEFWHAIRQIERATKATFFWDVSDTFTSDTDWLEMVAALRPSDFEGHFHAYARANDVRTTRVVRGLKKIGVVEVLVGAESFDDRVLARTNKGTTSAQILRGIQLLSDYGIGIALSLIFGLPGENAESLKRTLAVCDELRGRPEIVEMHASVITPLPGSRLFDELFHDEPNLGHLWNTDTVPHDEVLDRYVSRFTECTIEDLFEAFLAVDNMFPSAGPFFMRKDSPAFARLGYRGVI
ncbi:MAG: radical SAM protein [Acidobacteriota bacterium]